MIRVAEALPCEHVDFLGFRLGEVLAHFPDEVTSGRVAGRKRSAEQRATKAYVKFVQAFAELETAVSQSSLGNGASVPEPPTTKKKLQPSCTTLARLPIAPTATPASGKVCVVEQPPKGFAARSRAMHKNLKDSKVFARSQRFTKWAVGISITLLLPRFTAQAAGFLLQIVVALVFKGVQQFMSQAAAESSRLGSQVIQFAETSLDICLTTDVPASIEPPSAIMATQLLTALLNGSSPLEAAEALQAQTPPTYQMPSSPWRVPGWALVAVGIAVKSARLL